MGSPRQTESSWQKEGDEQKENSVKNMFGCKGVKSALM